MNSQRGIPQRRERKQREHLAGKLNERALEVCKFLLPVGGVIGSEWRVGSVEGEPGKSLGVCLTEDKLGLWKDFAGEDDEAGRDLVSLWCKVRRVNLRAAAREIEQWLKGCLPADCATPHSEESAADKTPLEAQLIISAEEWGTYVSDLTDDILFDMCRWRGYSLDFGHWLRRSKLVALYDGGIGFPIHDERRCIKGIHYYLGKSKRWRTTCRAAPLIIGDLSTAKSIHVFESQWDAFALIDKLGFFKSKTNAVIVTRGASQAKLISGLIPQGRAVYAWKQNDPEKNGRRAGDEWLDRVCEHAGTRVKAVSIPGAAKDLNQWTKNGATAAGLRKAIDSATVHTASLQTPSPESTGAKVRTSPDRRPAIEFFSPLQLQRYRPPDGTILIGDCHVTRGSVFVIGGPPGVGKSRSTLALAVAGAKGTPWFGLPVHTRFRTLIVQNENGQFRLSRDFAKLDCAALDEYVRICAPPPLGFRFEDVEFTALLEAEIESFRPGVVIVDPWNAAAPDDRAKDYLETFEEIRRVIPPGDESPALGIVAHTRKPKNDDRASGRGLLNLLAGSYVLGSVPRTVFVMQAATDDPEDDTVIWTCCKNNDGELGERTAWHRRDGLFIQAGDFDWEEFAAARSAKRELISESDIAQVFSSGAPLTRADAVRILGEQTGAKRAACYNALKRFAVHVREDGNLLTWIGGQLNGNRCDG
jgi:hypothetical protein